MSAKAEVCLEIIKERRSVRSYTNQDVSPELVELLLRAAMAAPSGNDVRPWEFIVVRDRGLREKIAQTHRWARMAKDAPVVIVVCGDESSVHWISDTSAATENLLLAASANGLGAVWVGIYPTTSYEDYLRGVLGIPKNRRILCIIPIGWPAEPGKPKDKFDPSRIHYERY